MSCIYNMLYANLWNVSHSKIQFKGLKKNGKNGKNGKISFTRLQQLCNSEEKLPEDIFIRFLEDEGIFVGKPIELSPRNRYRLENVSEKPERTHLCHDEENVTQLINSTQFKPAKLDTFQ
ncbi:unnamed protein product [Allacma fusca]|uniref:Uncharacterized protein n=1 Tax=Allacma fusca TaxID=39272 RepID=A0A8J2JDY1_9HEXA|nr:unnamed protein product [Allacma fusca]